jgi:hypothetical protein
MTLDRSRAPSTGMEVLRHAEADLSLFEPAVRGFSLWPVLRFPAWQLVSGVSVGDPSRRGRALLRALGRRHGVFTYGAWSFKQRRRLRARHFDALFLTLEAHRLARPPEGWWDPYLDDIAVHPALAGRVLRIERRDFVMGRVRTVAPRHLFTDLQLLDQLRRGRPARPPEARAAAARVCDLLFDRVRAVAPNISATAEQTFRMRSAVMASRFYHESLWYEELLREFRPGVVALVDAYNQHGLVAAARASSIPVVEFQHGSIHGDHPGYIWFAPERAQRDRLPIPDRIATYGTFWSDVLTREGFWAPAEVPAVGSARIDRMRQTPRAGAPTLRIVFTSQFATRRQAIQLLAEFLSLAEKENLDYTLTIKVHRGERAYVAQYEALRRQSARVSVASPYEADTLELIAGADVHVSGWSTCHYEAIALGTPTVVLIFPGPDRVEGLSGFSSVFRASTARELLDGVRAARQMQKADPATRQDESERLFRRGAVEHAVALLQACAASGSDPPA